MKGVPGVLAGNEEEVMCAIVLEALSGPVGGSRIDVVVGEFAGVAARSSFTVFPQSKRHGLVVY